VRSAGDVGWCAQGPHSRLFQVLRCREGTGVEVGEGGWRTWADYGVRRWFDPVVSSRQTARGPPQSRSRWMRSCRPSAGCRPPGHRSGGGGRERKGGAWCRCRQNYGVLLSTCPSAIEPLTALATADPPMPMATPMSARFSAGESLTPSPARCMQRGIGA